MHSEKYSMGSIKVKKVNLYNIIKEELSKYTTVYEHKFDNVSYKPQVYQFDTILEESLFIFNNASSCPKMFSFKRLYKL